MKSAMLSAAVCMALGIFQLTAHQALASSLELRSLPVHAAVSVGADGQVTNVVVQEAKLSPAVKSVVVDNVKRWRFEPVIVDGAPLPALTYVNIDTCAIPSGDGYNLLVKYVDNGPFVIGSQHPEYPLNVFEYGGGHVAFTVKLRALADGHGEIQDILMQDVRPSIVRDLRGAVVRWIAALRFQPEQVNGELVATDLEWPIILTTVKRRVELTDKPIERPPGAFTSTEAACVDLRDMQNRPIALSLLKLHIGP